MAAEAGHADSSLSPIDLCVLVRFDLFREGVSVSTISDLDGFHDVKRTMLGCAGRKRGFSIGSHPWLNASQFVLVDIVELPVVYLQCTPLDSETPPRLPKAVHD